jgi:hypothetical protein
LTETLFIFLIFFVYAGWAPPDVNEAHYLSKAKHYWNPEWCAGDHFLQSADAHLVFYWTIGWLTKWLPLGSVAWIGRVLTWSLLAATWRALSFAVAPRAGYSVLTAALAVCFWSRAGMAGEWVIGGLEAKGIAYGLVLLGLRALALERWPAAWLWFGAASALHVLVGGWSIVAAAIAWLLMGRANWPTIRYVAPALVGCILLALPGLLPAVALNWGEQPSLVRKASEIYVFQRLDHHLVLHRFPPLFVAMHVLLVAAWLVLSWRLVADNQQYKRLCAFVAGAVLIALAGALIDFATRHNPALAAQLLRFYWFRLSDAMVPVGAACAVVVALVRLESSRPLAGQWLLAVAICLATLSLTDQILRRRQDPRPGADVQGQLAAPDREGDAQSVYGAWRDVCRWIDTAMPADARFLTPCDQQTFKWHASRSEVVNWKDIPQDAVGICQWWKRYQQVHALEQPSVSLAERRQQLLTLAERYSFQYVLALRGPGTTSWGFPTVYRNRSFAVYRVPRGAENAAPDEDSASGER